MSTPETRLDPGDLQNEEVEPLPTTEDRLLSHLEHLRNLWERHTKTLGSNREEHDAIKAEIREAYRTILETEPFLEEPTTELLLQPETLEAARFELWFARHHLDKVIK